MNKIKFSFTDNEILFYGRESGFIEDEALCLLNEGNITKNDDALLRMAKENPILKEIADYTAQSFMNPKSALRVFSGIGKEFLRFRAAMPEINDLNVSTSAYALVFNAANEGYMGCENYNTLFEMMIELSGFDSSRQVKPFSFELSPVDLFVLLGACDVILKNKYDGGRFTEISILNAFDLTDDVDFNRICSPLADIASDIIIRNIKNNRISESLAEMTKAGILEVTEMEGIKFYSFTNEYRYILNIFVSAQNRLAILRYDENGQADIIYIITNNSETYGFSVQNGAGRIERLDENSINALLLKPKDKVSYCINCGTKLPPEARFCPSCGTRI